VVVAAGRLDLDNAVADVEERDVKGAATRSKTRILADLPSPGGKRAAEVGSLIRRTLRPAIVPASLVACRCASLKYAGT